jgi:hypothetical protein
MSDMHFHTLNSAGNRVLATKDEGNDNNSNNASSLFKEDFEYLINVFKSEQNFAFAASPGDVATYDLNDLIYFTNIANACLDGHPFYCATGNHDHGLIYYDQSPTTNGRFLDTTGTTIYGDSTGGRWNSINGYNCPKTLIGSGVTYFENNGSYYVEY